MTKLPRILALMGSGETAPTMKATHRAVFDQLEAAAGPNQPGVVIDTPFGFQENHPTLAAKTVEYFDKTIGRTVEIADLPQVIGGDTVSVEAAIARIRAANWIFAGPGSPTYTLRHWANSPIAAALTDKLTTGGALVFSSAAVLTLGRKTIPVYEIYKAGADPYWEDGLAVLDAIGLPVVVIPHYDNTEGGHHDTSKCYLGERRLRAIEGQLDDDTFILGIDEHTGAVFDLEVGTVEVVGKGGITLRKNGESVRYEAGSTLPFATIQAGPDGAGIAPAIAPAPDAPTTLEPENVEVASLGDEASRLETVFGEAIANRDANAAVEAILDLDTAMVEWSRDSLQSDDLARARTSLRSMVVRLGAAATEGVRDPRAVLGPVVDAALAARVTAREEKAYAVSDAIRDNLVEAGIEVKDTPDGAVWDLKADT